VRLNEKVNILPSLQCIALFKRISINGSAQQKYIGQLIITVRLGYPWVFINTADLITVVELDFTLVSKALYRRG
jgi:hypothetical protein